MKDALKRKASYATLSSDFPSRSAEHTRLHNSQKRLADWKRWGPYLSERAWGTVREDYSADGNAWDSFPHDHARSRAYRWNEDGIAGFCNRHQNICLAIGLWNEKDPILKERLYGLTGSEGNHGEDVKEYYFYQDSTPTHSYAKMLYKYPHDEYPYQQLLAENRRRSRAEMEYELVDWQRERVWQQGRYFDVQVEYAKAGQEDILCRITVTNAFGMDDATASHADGGGEGADPDGTATVHVLPHIWYRNRWSWGWGTPRDRLWAEQGCGDGAPHADHGAAAAAAVAGAAEAAADAVRTRRCSGADGSGDAFSHDHIFEGIAEVVVEEDGQGGEEDGQDSDSDGSGDDGGSGGVSRVIRTRSRHLGERFYYACAARDTHAAGERQRDGGALDEGLPLFTENDTNNQRLFGSANESAYVKDGINDFVVSGGAAAAAVNPEAVGSKAAVQFSKKLRPGQAWTVMVRFTDTPKRRPFARFHAHVDRLLAEADAFYAAIQPPSSAELKLVQRQAFAGLLWSKQFYHLGVEMWLKGDPNGPPPPASRLAAGARNVEWRHLYNCDVITMPDKWEYPWYAAWDLAFHCIPLCMVDPEWAKRQLLLMLREWYMHPNGQMAAYEWNFGDVNPPVHAWACMRVYQISRSITGEADTEFLEKCFHKLLLNFTWWVNRKDASGKNLFEGGFLGLDNIGVFDRSMPLPEGHRLEQADGTAWMAMYCLNMLSISLELAVTRPAYEDVATKFFEHFVAIAHSINPSDADASSSGLWDSSSGFFYDVLQGPGGDGQPTRQFLKVRSFVGLIPLFAVMTIEESTLQRLPAFKRRLDWFITHRPHLLHNITTLQAEEGHPKRRLLSVVNKQQLRELLDRMLDESEFLSPHGLRSLSKVHEHSPYVLNLQAQGIDNASIRYEAAESTSPMYGGNSNWRGPVWFPVNYLMIESLQKFDYYFKDSLTVPCPTTLPNGAPGPQMSLWQVAAEVSARLIRTFTKDQSGCRPVNGHVDLFNHGRLWADNIPFYEFFHGDNGAGIGASHQTGWTALVAKLVQQSWMAVDRSSTAAAAAAGSGGAAEQKQG